jgi:hypothetical protein
MFFMLCTPMATVNVDIKSRMRKALRAAINRVYDSDKAACGDMAVKQSHYSEEMAGERALNLDAKTNLDLRVWSWFAVFLAMEFGIPEEFDTAQRLRVARKTMARCELRPVADRRSA